MNTAMNKLIHVCSGLGFQIPGMAVNNVGEDLRQAWRVFEVLFRVVPVDGALSVPISVFLSLSQLVIAGVHGCQ